MPDKPKPPHDGARLLDQERFILNPESGLPLYLQIAHEFIYRIETGLLQTGDKLPGIRSLAKDLKISFLTVDKAYRWLRSRGVVTSRPGVDVTVALSMDSSSELTHQRRQLNKYADKVLAQVLNQHLDPLLFAQTLLRRASAMQRRVIRKLVFIECFPEYVDDYTAVLRRELADFRVEITGLLTTALPAAVKSRNAESKIVSEADYLMTTLYHYDFVHRVLAPLKPRVVALSHTLDEEAMRKIMSLPRQSRLGALLGPVDPAPAIMQTLEFYRDVRPGSMPFAVITDAKAVRKLVDRTDVLLYTAACQSVISQFTNKKSAILMRFVPDHDAINKVRVLLGNESTSSYLGMTL
jgi:DNA-binding transcriptional regulator YhcF (GntR family)